MDSSEGVKGKEMRHTALLLLLLLLLRSGGGQGIGLELLLGRAPGIRTGPRTPGLPRWPPPPLGAADTRRELRGRRGYISVLPPQSTPSAERIPLALL